jgi:hypothetical protein
VFYNVNAGVLLTAGDVLLASTSSPEDIVIATACALVLIGPDPVILVHGAGVCVCM